MEREREGVQTWVCSCSAQRFVKRDSHDPLVPFILISEMHSHSLLSGALPHNLESITVTFLKVRFSLGYILSPIYSHVETQLSLLHYHGFLLNAGGTTGLLKPLAVAFNVIFMAVFENDTSVRQRWKLLRCLRCILRQHTCKLFTRNTLLRSRCCIKPCFSCFFFLPPACPVLLALLFRSPSET